MAYKVYKGTAVADTVASTTTTVTGLSPATSYVFTVTESDGADESAKSNQVTVTTNGRLTIPTTKEVVSVMYCIDALGIETNGLGTGTSFGGTVPVSVSVLKNVISGTNRVLEVASGYHMGNQSAVLVEPNKYLIIHGNTSMEIIVQ